MRRIFFIVLIIVSYLLIINILSLINFNIIENYIDYNQDQENYGTTQRLGFGESVSVSVKRNRWYGIIYESGAVSNLYIFQVLRLPLKNDNFNFKIIHFIFFLLVILFLMFYYIKYRNNERRSNYHEKHIQNSANYPYRNTNVYINRS